MVSSLKKSIHTLAIPSIFSGLAEPLVSMTDTIMVGKTGEEAIGAVGLGISLFMFFAWVLISGRGAVASLIAQNLSNHHRELTKIANLSRSWFLVFSVFFSGIIFLSSNLLLECIGAEKGLLQQGDNYLKIRAIGLPLMIISYLNYGILKGLQNTSFAFYITLFSSLINIILDFVLISGIENLIPEFGVKGAAWASVISQGIMATLSTIVLIYKFGIKFNLTFQNDGYVKKLFQRSGDLFIRTILLNVFILLANREATKLGDFALAAHTICFQLWIFSAFFIDGYATAATALSGKYSGQKKFQIYYILNKLVIQYGLIIAGIAMLSLLGLKQILPAIFNKSLGAIRYVYKIYYILILIQPLNAIAFIFDGIYIGSGCTKILRDTMIIATGVGLLAFFILNSFNILNLETLWMVVFLWILIRGIG